MQRVTKIVISAVVAVVILCLAAPFFFGFAAKHYTTTFARRESRTLGSLLGLRVELKNYKRGWFTSSAQMELQKKMGDSYQTVDLIPIKIQHGPFFQAHGHLSAGLGVIHSVEQGKQTDEPYTLAFDESISFIGEHSLLITMKSDGHTDLFPGMSFKTLAIIGHGNIEAKQFNLHFNFTGLRAQSPTSTVVLQAAQAQIALRAHYIKPQHWKLESGVNFDKMRVGVLHAAPTHPGILAQADKVQVKDLHINTQTMAHLVSQALVLQLKSQLPQHPDMLGAWMQLLQKTISSMVNQDTLIQIVGLSVDTPMGPIHVNYHVTFPLLPKKHDYFDIAMRDVGMLGVQIPHFHVMSEQHNWQFALSHFALDSQSNTIFSRRAKMQFDVLSLSNIQPEKHKLNVYASDFLYDGQLEGNISSLTQSMSLRLGKFCWLGDCFKNITTDFSAADMDAHAFHQIDGVAQQFVKHHQLQQVDSESLASHWVAIMNAYAQLATPKTQLKFSTEMDSPKGEITVHAGVLWKHFPVVGPKQKIKMSELAQHANYHLRVLFPAAYLQALFAHVDAIKTAEATQAQAAQEQVNADSSADSSEPAVQTAQMAPKKQTPDEQLAIWLHYAIKKGYLKSAAGDGYAFDLTGQGDQFTINGVPWVLPSAGELGVAQPAAS